MYRIENLPYLSTSKYCFPALVNVGISAFQSLSMNKFLGNNIENALFVSIDLLG